MVQKSHGEMFRRLSSMTWVKPEKKKTTNTLVYRSTNDDLGRPRTPRVRKLLVDVRGSRSN